MAEKAVGLRPAWEKRDDSITEKLARANLRDTSPQTLPKSMITKLERKKGARK